MNDYPSESDLQRIRDWPHDDLLAMIDFIAGIWHWEDYFKRGVDIVITHTGGWSGNEDIISAMEDNKVFWCMCWQSSERGGKHVFDISSLRK
jgi:hypothetical protein